MPEWSWSLVVVFNCIMTVMTYEFFPFFLHINHIMPFGCAEYSFLGKLNIVTVLFKIIGLFAWSVPWATLLALSAATLFSFCDHKCPSHSQAYKSLFVIVSLIVSRKLEWVYGILLCADAKYKQYPLPYHELPINKINPFALFCSTRENLCCYANC